jgi:RNA polymerase sigma factor (sigma-70 family)
MPSFAVLPAFTYQGKGSLSKWITTILINESLRILKKRNAFQFENESDQKDIRSLQPDGFQQLNNADIVRMIEQLPTGYRTVFNLFIIEGFSHREIANMLGISENTVKIGLNWSLFKGRSVFVSPQLYFSDNFKTIYPAVRIGFGL